MSSLKPEISDCLHIINSCGEEYLETVLPPHLRGPVAKIVEVFRYASVELREEISGQVNDRGHFVLAIYTRALADEALRTGREELVEEALIPIVVAHGRSDTATGGMLLSIVLHSANRWHLNAPAIFARCAALATDSETKAQVSAYPSLSKHKTSIDRWGWHEYDNGILLKFRHAAEVAPPFLVRLRHRVNRWRLFWGL